MTFDFQAFAEEKRQEAQRARLAAIERESVQAAEDAYQQRWVDVISLFPPYEPAKPADEALPVLLALGRSIAERDERRHLAGIVDFLQEAGRCFASLIDMAAAPDYDLAALEEAYAVVAVAHDVADVFIGGAAEGVQTKLWECECGLFPYPEPQPPPAATSSPTPSVECPADAPAAPGMSWQEAAREAEKIRQSGRDWTSYDRMAVVIGCSSSLLYKAVGKKPDLRKWAKSSGGAPRAQSFNEVISSHTAQTTEWSPEDEAAEREFLEKAAPDLKAAYLSMSREAQLFYLNDPDRHLGNPAGADRLFGRRP